MVVSARARFGWIMVMVSLLAGLLVLSPGAAPVAAAAEEPVVYEPGEPSRAGAGGPAAATPVAPAERVEEVEAARSEVSQTFELSDGSLETVVRARPVHFQGDDGWEPIGNELVAVDDAGEVAARNGAAAHELVLPSDLAVEPVRLSQDGVEVAFQLRGASGAPVLDGSSASYADALPGVDVVYTALGQGVKEDLVLAGPASASEFVFDLELSEGAEVRASTDGGVEVLREGEVVFRFLTPWMQDSSGTPSGVSTDVKLAVEGSTLRLTADEAWLTAPERVWPVTIDPAGVFVFTPYTPNKESCTLRSGSQALTPYCSTRPEIVGRENGESMRALLRFSTAAVPTFSQVLHAELRMEVVTASSPAGVDVRVHELTTDYTTGATWTNSGVAGSPNWNGGSYNTEIAASGTLAPGGWRSLYPTALVQRWVSGATPNNGFLLKAAAETATTSWVSFPGFTHDPSITDDPQLIIRHHHWMGAQDFYSTQDWSLTDRSSMNVNLANGNLLVANQDLYTSGVGGMDFAAMRTYNSHRDQPGLLGPGWVTNLGDIDLMAFGGGSVTMNGPTGEQVPFHKKPDGTFAAPPWFRGDLTETNGEKTVTMWDTKEKWVFAANGKLRFQRDRNDQELEFGYLPDGTTLSTVTDTRGLVTTLTYAGPLIDKVTDDVDRVVDYNYDSNGRLEEVIDVAGEVTRYAYGTNGKLSKVTTARGNVTDIVYHANGRVWTVKFDPDTTTADPTWTFRYYGDHTTVADPRNATFLTKHYRAPLNAASASDPSRPIRMHRVVDANGNERTTSFTANGNVATYAESLTAAGNYSYSYDSGSGNKLEQVTAPTGANTQYTYPSTGPNPYAPNSRTDPQGNTTAFVYDTPGNLVETSHADGTEVFERRVQGPNENCGTLPGLLCRTIAPASDEFPAGQITVYDYDNDDLGLVETITHPSVAGQPSPLGTESFTYDTLFRVRSHVDGRGQRTCYSYNGFDQVTELRSNASSDCKTGPTIVYAYDEDGNVTSRTDTTGTTSFGYDDMNRPKQKNLPGAANACAGQTGMRFEYDLAGNLRTYCDAGGTITYGYNKVNLVDTLTDPQGLVTTFTYDDRDRRTLTRFPSGFAERVEHDDSGRIREVRTRKSDNTLVTRFQYTYDQAPGGDDRMLRQTFVDHVTSQTTAYEYDRNNRLERASSPAGLYEYGYDVYGNRKFKTEPSQPQVNYTYNIVNQLTHIDGTGGFTYDGNGNETAAPGRASQFNPLDQTTQITPTGGTPLTLGYADADSTERVTAGTKAFTTSILGLASSTDTTGPATYYTRDNLGNLIGTRTATGQKSYFIHDGLGSIVGIIDHNQNRTATYTYDPYGNHTATGTAAAANPFRYAGGYHDTQTGLTKFGTRYYDPTIARWTQTDPLPGQLSYAYAGNNPINNVDPSGYLLDELVEVGENLLTGKTLVDAVSLGLAGDEEGLGALLAGEAAAFLTQATCIAGAAAISGGTLTLAGGVVCTGISEAVGYGIEEVAN